MHSVLSPSNGIFSRFTSAKVYLLWISGNITQFLHTPFIEATSEPVTKLRNNEFSKVQNFLNFVSTFWQNIAGLKTQIVNNSTLPNNIEQFYPLSESE